MIITCIKQDKPYIWKVQDAYLQYIGQRIIFLAKKCPGGLHELLLTHFNGSQKVGLQKLIKCLDTRCFAKMCPVTFFVRKGCISFINMSY